MFNEKCAYCESSITHIDFGAIEHFKPKSRFPLLSLSWNNLFFSCNICNSQNYKGDKWYSSNQDGPLVNPVDDDPRKHFKFEYDEDTGLAIVKAKTRRGKLTIETLGLNRVALLRRRSDYIRRLTALLLNSEADCGTLQDIFAIEFGVEEYSAFFQSLSYE